MIVLAVRWYRRFGRSHRDVEELLAERGVEVDHVTVYRRVVRFTPLLADARLCRRPLAGGRDLREGRRPLALVQRAVGQHGQVVDVLVCPRRDVNAARRFFEQAIDTAGPFPPGW